MTFLHAHREVWLGSLIALIGSAAVLAAAIWFFLPFLYMDGTVDSHRDSVRLTGDTFQVVTGSGATRDGQSLVAADLRDGQLILRRDVWMLADSHSMVRLDLSGVHPDLQVALFWRHLDTVGQLHAMVLRRGAANVTWHLAGASPDWRGRVVELAIGVFGSETYEPVRLDAVSLEPATRMSLVRLVWQDWRLLLPWTQASINHYPGVPVGAPLHPVVVMTVWLLLAAVFLWGIARLRCWSFFDLRPGLVVVVLAPWLLLDGLWQLRLVDQAASTQTRFGGLPPALMWERAHDADLWEQAQNLLDELDPVRGKRLFLVHDSSGHDFNRLRLQNHLLPLNVYNFGNDLRALVRARPGDFVLLLDVPEAVRFDPDSRSLHDGRRRFRAESVMVQPRFEVFQLRDRVAVH